MQVRSRKAAHAFALVVGLKGRDSPSPDWPRPVKPATGTVFRYEKHIWLPIPAISNTLSQVMANFQTDRLGVRLQWWPKPAKQPLTHQRFSLHRSLRERPVGRASFKGKAKGQPPLARTRHPNKPASPARSEPPCPCYPRSRRGAGVAGQPHFSWEKKKRPAIASLVL